MMHQATKDLYFPPEYLEYIQEQNAALKKYQNRNEAYIKEGNFNEAMEFIINYQKDRPKELYRDKLGDAVFEAHLHISGCTNTIFMELAREQLNIKTLDYCFDLIIKSKAILDDANKNS